MELKRAVEDRKIEFVWHFTRLENLESILQEGLIPRSELERRRHPPDFNDPFRYDRQKDAICCSISFPNYKMFYTLRTNCPDVEWVIIAIEPSVLWEKECAFCVENAASNHVTCITINQRQGIAAFNKLFENTGRKPTRESLKIPEPYPTNPQAEVLILGRVEPSYIIGAVCQSDDLARELKRAFPDFDFICDPNLFLARHDYQSWKTYG